MLATKIKFSNLMQIGILTSLLIFVSISFNVFSYLEIMSYIVWGICCISFVMMSLLFIRRPIISYFDFAIIIYLFILVTSSIINGTDIKNAIYKTIEVFLLIYIFNYRHNIKLIAKTCAIVLSCCAYLNLIVMILFPNWMFAAKDTFYSHLLGGNYNQIGCRLITAILINILCLKMNRKWIVNIIILSIVSIITLAWVGSMTSLSCIILFCLFCMIPSYKLKNIALVSFFSFFIFFQSVVVFSGEGLHNNPYAVYLIEDVLHKDITFTNRTEMWDSAAKKVSESPLIGYGWVDTDWYISNMSSFAIGPHNFIYSVLINGGIILLFILIIIFILAIRNIFHSYDKIANILLFGISTLLFMMTMEVYPFFFLFILLFFTYYYPLFKNNPYAPAHKAIQPT